MRRLTAALLGLVTGGGVVFLAFTYHLVRAEEGLLFVPKAEAALADAFVDVRNWDAAQWQQHSSLMRSLTEHGRSDLIVEPSSRAFIRDLLQGLGGASPLDADDANRQ